MTTATKMMEDDRPLFGNISYFDITGEIIFQEKQKLKVKVSDTNLTTIRMLDESNINLVGRMVYAQGYINNGKLMATNIIMSTEEKTEVNEDAQPWQG